MHSVGAIRSNVDWIRYFVYRAIYVTTIDNSPLSPGICVLLYVCCVSGYIVRKIMIGIEVGLHASTRVHACVQCIRLSYMYLSPWAGDTMHTEYHIYIFVANYTCLTRKYFETQNVFKIVIWSAICDIWVSCVHLTHAELFVLEFV